MRGVLFYLSAFICQIVSVICLHLTSHIIKPSSEALKVNETLHLFLISQCKGDWISLDCCFRMHGCFSRHSSHFLSVLMISSLVLLFLCCLDCCVSQSISAVFVIKHFQYFLHTVCQTAYEVGNCSICVLFLQFYVT